MCAHAHTHTHTHGCMRAHNSRPSSLLHISVKTLNRGKLNPVTLHHDKIGFILGIQQEKAHDSLKTHTKTLCRGHDIGWLGAALNIFYFLKMISFWYLKKIFIYLFLFLAALGFCCCTQAFSSSGERGANLRCSAQASHFGGFSCCGAQALGTRAQ